MPGDSPITLRGLGVIAGIIFGVLTAVGSFTAIGMSIVSKTETMLEKHEAHPHADAVSEQELELFLAPIKSDVSEMKETMKEVSGFLRDHTKTVAEIGLRLESHIKHEQE